MKLPEDPEEECIICGRILSVYPHTHPNMEWDEVWGLCEKCDATIIGHKWSKIKEYSNGWYFMKDGRVWCPKHRPPWAPRLLPFCYLQGVHDGVD